MCYGALSNQSLSKQNYRSVWDYWTSFRWWSGVQIRVHLHWPNTNAKCFFAAARCEEQIRFSRNSSGSDFAFAQCKQTLRPKYESPQNCTRVGWSGAGLPGSTPNMIISVTVHSHCPITIQIKFPIPIILLYIPMDTHIGIGSRIGIGSISVNTPQFGDLKNQVYSPFWFKTLRSGQARFGNTVKSLFYGTGNLCPEKGAHSKWMADFWMADFCQFFFKRLHL